MNTAQQNAASPVVTCNQRTENHRCLHDAAQRRVVWVVIAAQTEATDEMNRSTRSRMDPLRGNDRETPAPVARWPRPAPSKRASPLRDSVNAAVERIAALTARRIPIDTFDKARRAQLERDQRDCLQRG